jgi:hypothetical protein
MRHIPKKPCNEEYGFSSAIAVGADATHGMKAIVDSLRLSEIDLITIDNEGTAQTLLTGPPEWLSQTKAITANVRSAEGQGFKYIPANSPFSNKMTNFYRVGREARS